MCGIFGYYGRHNASAKIIEGLKRLEYRGYDSWGIVGKNLEKNFLHKQVGEIGNPKNYNFIPESDIALGHTRWATHGGVSELNAHPHRSKLYGFAVVHNGIVENYEELKAVLEKTGEAFKTQTDTESILRLLEKAVGEGQRLLEAVQYAALTVEGRNTFAVIDFENSSIYASKNGSPLVIGFTEDSDEIYLSSDTHSFSPWVSEICVVKNGQIVEWQKTSGVKLFEAKNLKEIEGVKEELKIENAETDKGGFEHYMLKEIFETPTALRKVTKQDKKQLEGFVDEIKKAKNVYFMASGSSGMTAKQMAYYLRKHGKIGAQGLVGAEATEYFDLFDENDLIFSPSQSGETADVLEVLEIAKEKGTKIASIVNMLGSSMTRISDWGFMSEAGPEICVMTTKVLTSQMAWGYLVSKACQNKYDEGLREILKLVDVLEDFLQNKNKIEQIKELAKILTQKEHIYMLAKGQNLNIAGEGMVKIIEGAYVHAHAMPAGDLKHYAITLMEEGTPVVVTVSDDENMKDVLSAAAEVATRGAEVFMISNEVESKYTNTLMLPKIGELDALFNIVVFQLLAYFMAVEKGNNVDKPRNIAKSVTVK